MLGCIAAVDTSAVQAREGLRALNSTSVTKEILAGFQDAISTLAGERGLAEGRRRCTVKARQFYGAFVAVVLSGAGFALSRSGLEAEAL